MSSEEDVSDQDLCAHAVGGDARALERLVRRHQRWVYNLALRLVLSPADAEDLAQEALIRMITRLAQFQGRSAFRTWAYRIVVNCFLDSKRGKLEHAITSFDAYGAELNELSSTPLGAEEPDPERLLLIEEAKVGCMLGMLLCLSREQRVAYVLGEIVGATSPVAAEVLGISASAYRKRLERARRDLIAFMNDTCGLVNAANPCRCARKTKAFIQEGWVDPQRLKFTSAHVSRQKQAAPSLSRQLDTLELRAAALFREHPWVDAPDLAVRIIQLMRDASPSDDASPGG